jgi:uncharacterized YccA/Bax inhibitor family protein
MIQSKNPVLQRAEAFQPHQQFEQGQAQQGYFVPAAGQAGAPAAQTMTIDDVLAKSAITMGVLISVAALTMRFLPLGLLWPVTAVAGLVAFGTVLLVSFRRAVNPAFVLLYAGVEGLFIGAISQSFEMMYPGIVLPAVFGTFVTAGVTLAGYHFLRIRVTGRLRKMVIIGTISLAGVYFINVLLSIFGVHTGIIEVGPGAGMLSILCSALGVGLAVFNLLIDFEMVETGVRNQAPASESWRAAFGLAVTMVWLYTELLRILSYFQRD